jgi:broad specificity phosphatase PhoE
VPSRWTKREIDAERGHLHDRSDDWNIYQVGVETLEDAQARVTVKLTRVLPEISAWAASLPPGILKLDSWLIPAQLLA